MDEQREKPTTAGELVTVKELAAYLKVKRGTLYSMILPLDIPHYKIGRLVRFRMSEVEAWLKHRGNDTKPAPRVRTKIINLAHARSAKEIAKKAIDKVLGNAHVSSGKPTGSRASRKEVEHGNL